MIDVFISYSRANKDVAGRLAETVKRLGYSVWWDEKLPAHLSHEEAIAEQVGAAKAAIVLWSRGSAESKWVRAEAECARGRDILIQTSIDGSAPPAPFDPIGTATIRDWAGELDHPGWRQVQARLVALCGMRQAASLPLPVTPSRPGAARAGRTNRIALATIAASVMTILSVGGLVLVNGPPAARAQATPPIMAASMTMPEPAARRSTGPAIVPIKTAITSDAAEPALLFPDSSTRELSEEEVAGLSRDDLRVARNEILARNGRIFRDPDARDYFARFAWYQPVAEEVSLNPVEEANVDLLRRAEAW